MWRGRRWVERLEKDRREDAAARPEIAGAAFDGMAVVAHLAAYHLWLILEPHQRPDRIAAELAEDGILVSTGDAFASGTYRPYALRLALGTPRAGELGPVLRRVREMIVEIAP